MQPSYSLHFVLSSLQKHALHAFRGDDVTCSWDGAAFVARPLPGGFSASRNPSRKGVEKLDGLHELMLADVARPETVR